MLDLIFSIVSAAAMYADYWRMRLGASEAAFGILLYESELLRLAPTPSLPFPSPTTSTVNDCRTTWSLRPLFLFFVIFLVLVGIPCLLIARLHESVLPLPRKIERLLKSVRDHLTRILTRSFRFVVLLCTPCLLSLIVRLHENVLVPQKGKRLLENVHGHLAGVLTSTCLRHRYHTGIPCLKPTTARLPGSVFVLLRKIERLLESVCDRLTSLLTSNLQSEYERASTRVLAAIASLTMEIATIRQNFDDRDSQIAKLKELLGASGARHLETEKVCSDMKNEFDTWKQKNEELKRANKGQQQQAEEVRRLQQGLADAVEARFSQKPAASAAGQDFPDSGHLPVDAQPADEAKAQAKPEPKNETDEAEVSGAVLEEGGEGKVVKKPRKRGNKLSKTERARRAELLLAPLRDDSLAVEPSDLLPVTPPFPHIQSRGKGPSNVGAGAWAEFSQTASKREVEEAARLTVERQGQELRLPSMDVTWKPVKLSEGGKRRVVGAEKSRPT